MKIIKFLLILTLLGTSLDSVSFFSPASAQTVDQAEDFKTFLDRFKKDPEFQKSRTTLPLPIETLDMDDKDLKITEKEWEYDPMFWQPSFKTRAIDAYDQIIEEYKNTATVKFVGVNNGINIKMIFRKCKGRWFYTKLIDYST